MSTPRTEMSGCYFIVGGAGFIGSHFTDRLLAGSGVNAVTLFDNFSSGKEWHYESHRKDPRLRVVRGDAKDLATLTECMRGHDVVIHLASNPDIARATTEPDIDFREGTCLTNNVVEAMRLSGVRKILYASGSGVYGDLGEIAAHEDRGPLLPISTYAASKLAGETLISAYCYMFDLEARIFRFGNVVGPRQTHGVGFDFLRQLLAHPCRLRILGDGTQSKSYIHVRDVVEAVLLAAMRSVSSVAVYNVATGDYITVAEIARLAVECAGLDPSRVEYEFTGGDRGWKGDVPVVRLNTDRIRALGWVCGSGCRQALRDSMQAMLQDFRVGRT
jgi:UDP-glucose 4-epimerase